MRRRIKRKRGPVVSKKITVDGIKFASGLEAYMYKALKRAKIKADYENIGSTVKQMLSGRFQTTEGNVIEVFGVVLV